MLASGWCKLNIEPKKIAVTQFYYTKTRLSLLSFYSGFVVLMYTGRAEAFSRTVAKTIVEHGKKSDQRELLLAAVETGFCH